MLDKLCCAIANSLRSPQSKLAESSGNSYYEFPAGLPVVGVAVMKLPLNNFDIDLIGYDAYDKDRVPFVVDIKAFFRVADFKIAAERISDTAELEKQLLGIVQGAVRSILAKEPLDTIMEERATYGIKFTNEVQEQLTEWGVAPVMNIELMDVRDAKGESVISNVMEMKKSAIEKDSRIEVAKNQQAAKEAEIAKEREIELREQDKIKEVGLRKAQVKQETGIADEIANQAVAEQAKETATKKMAVLEVQTIRQAEIDKDKALVQAKAKEEQALIDKNAMVTVSEANKEKERLEAEAKLIAVEKSSQELEVKAKAEKEQKRMKSEADLIAAQNSAKAVEVEATAQAAKIKLEAEANASKIQVEADANAKKIKVEADANASKIEVEGVAEAKIVTAKGTAEADATSAIGLAKADAQKAMERALVQGQIDLAAQIGENEGYQTYLIRVRQVEVEQAVGIAQAKALENAGIKIVAQGGSASEGLNKAIELFGPKGAQAASGFLETLSGTELGKSLLEKFGVKNDDVKFEEPK